jgi:hypothetical protein
MMTFWQTREALVFTVPSVVSGVAKGFSADITPIIGEVRYASFIFSVHYQPLT